MKNEVRVPQFNDMCSDVAGVMIRYLPLQAKVQLRHTSTPWKQCVDDYYSTVLGTPAFSEANINLLDAEERCGLYTAIYEATELHHVPINAHLLNAWWSEAYDGYNQEDSQDINAAVTTWTTTMTKNAAWRGGGYFHLELLTVTIPVELNWLLDYYHDKQQQTADDAVAMSTRLPSMAFVGRAVTSNPLLQSLTPSNRLLPPLSLSSERIASKSFPTTLFNPNNAADYAAFCDECMGIGMAHGSVQTSPSYPLPLLEAIVSNAPSALFNKHDILFPHTATPSALREVGDNVLSPFYGSDIDWAVGFLWRQRDGSEGEGNGMKWWLVQARLVGA